MNKAGIIADLVRLRLSLAVTFSAVTGYFIHQPTSLDRLPLVIAGVFLLASASTVFNQISERDYDSKMERTRTRPLPGSIISTGRALLIAVSLLVSGTLVLLPAGIVPALLGLLTIVIYNVIYTRLKRVTHLAVVPGAVVGAIPPLIGYTAAGTDSLNPGILVFATFMFMWQLPHFWLIIIKYRDDYARAGFRTITDSYPEKKIRLLIFTWVLLSSILIMGSSLSGIIFGKDLNILLVTTNILFIFLFRHYLFARDGKTSTTPAFILINSFSLVLMLIFIFNSIFRG
ncbi:MAG: protoheme IX farnesyltransferase [Bacteroidales bacterium]